jgi:acetoin utilization deacetylase AcuC-like enzyme
MLSSGITLIDVYDHLNAFLFVRTKVSSVLLPRLKNFQADLLIISSGFDAHHEDLYHFLDDQSIHWLTAQLCSCVENTGGRVLSILEGGYSLEATSAPPPSGTRQTKAKSKTTPVSTEESGAETLPSVRANRGRNKKYEDGKLQTPPASATPEKCDPDSAFAQISGDGGLVRG